MVLKEPYFFHIQKIKHKICRTTNILYKKNVSNTKHYNYVKIYYICFYEISSRYYLLCHFTFFNLKLTCQEQKYVTLKEKKFRGKKSPRI